MEEDKNSFLVGWLGPRDSLTAMIGGFAFLEYTTRF